MTRKVTRKAILRVWMRLQSAAFSPDIPEKHRKAVRTAMQILSEVQLVMRRKAIFDAGAKARKPHGRFEGGALGSLELMNWYDGYASTHPIFRNPYRSA